MDDTRVDFSIRLKDFRQKRGATQQEVADFIGVDKTTYAHYETGRRSPDLDRLKRLALYYNLTEELLGVERRPYDINSEKKPDIQWRFPVICFDTPIDMSRIYPTKQHTVRSVYYILKNDRRAASAMLFGSSTTIRCSKGSDLDIAIRLHTDYEDNATKNDISEMVQNASGWKADILWYDRLTKDDRVYSDILKGVQIL